MFGTMTRRAALLTLGVMMQVKRQAETRLREHFSEPLRAQVEATIKAEDEDDPRIARRRVPEPL